MSSTVPTNPEAAVPKRRSAREGKYLTFFLGGEEYGLEILKVQEIIGLLPITRVPRTPPFICGVINLRGKIIPVIDLHLRFRMPAAEHTHETCIIVVKTAGLDMGLIVDRMAVVVHIQASDIEEVPSFGVNIDTDFLLGIGKTDGKVKLLLDIDRVLTREESKALAELQKKSGQAESEGRT